VVLGLSSPPGCVSWSRRCWLGLSSPYCPSRSGCSSSCCSPTASGSGRAPNEPGGTAGGRPAEAPVAVWEPLHAPRWRLALLRRESSLDRYFGQDGGVAGAGDRPRSPDLRLRRPSGVGGASYRPAAGCPV